MTGRESGRDERNARRSSAITHGGSPLMPSHSQGAERRTERRAGHTGSRWLPRALVVGGLAEHEPAVGELLEAVVLPPESVGALPRTATAPPRASGGTADDRALPVPPGTVTHLADAS
jgi:hypothetical protein